MQRILFETLNHTSDAWANSPQTETPHTKGRTMIIFVGGLVGAGKSTIAKKLSDAFSCYYYDADETKRTIFEADPSYEHNLENGIPFSDETRMKVFKKVVEDLKDLRKTHSHVVVDETLHRRALRQELYKAATELYGQYLIVWVRADEDVIIQRLKSNKREGHILDDPILMYQSFRRKFQEFNRSVVVVNNNGDPDETIQNLHALIDAAAQLKDR
ncbi:MAG: AAA family ATPase [Halocynthiibacter sp.]